MDAAFFYRFCFCALSSGKSLPVRVALNLRSLDSLVTSESSDRNGVGEYEVM